MPVILAQERWRQEDYYETNLAFSVRPCPPNFYLQVASVAVFEDWLRLELRSSAQSRCLLHGCSYWARHRSLSEPACL